MTGSPSPASSAPPRYDELYPHKEETDEDYSVKKRGALLAAAEAAADLHLSRQDIVAGPSTRVEPIRLYDGKIIKRVELKQDRKLFFFWVCCSVSFVPAMTLLTAPSCPYSSSFLGSCSEALSRMFGAFWCKVTMPCRRICSLRIASLKLFEK